MFHDRDRPQLDDLVYFLVLGSSPKAKNSLDALEWTEEFTRSLTFPSSRLGHFYEKVTKGNTLVSHKLENFPVVLPLIILLFSLQLDTLNGYGEWHLDLLLPFDTKVFLSFFLLCSPLCLTLVRERRRLGLHTISLTTSMVVTGPETCSRQHSLIRTAWEGLQQCRYGWEIIGVSWQKR